MKKVLNFRFEIILSGIVAIASLVYLTFALAEKSVHLWLVSALGMLGSIATYILFYYSRKFLKEIIGD